jgi:hypothetical protein
MHYHQWQLADVKVLLLCFVLWSTPLRLPSWRGRRAHYTARQNERGNWPELRSCADRCPVRRFLAECRLKAALSVPTRFPLSCLSHSAAMPMGPFSACGNPSLAHGLIHYIFEPMAKSRHVSQILPKSTDANIVSLFLTKFNFTINSSLITLYSYFISPFFKLLQEWACSWIRPHLSTRVTRCVVLALCKCQLCIHYIVAFQVNGTQYCCKPERSTLLANICTLCGPCMSGINIHYCTKTCTQGRCNRPNLWWMEWRMV